MSEEQTTNDATKSTNDKSRKPRVSTAVLSRRIKATHGNITAVANGFGLERTGVWRRISKSPLLTAILEDARESFIDLAESQLGIAIDKGEAWAVERALKSRRAAVRGWSERQEVEHSFARMTDRQLADFIESAVGTSSGRDSGDESARPATPDASADQADA